MPLHHKRGDTRPAAPLVSRRALVAGAGALAASALAGCGQDAAPPSAAGASDKDVAQVVIAMNAASEPAAGFDPLVAWGCGEHVHEPLVQSTLIVTDENLGFECDLATDYRCTDDGLTWTFDIRDDARFSDGEPVTAADVAFTVNSVAHGGTSQADLSMVDEAVATGDYAVEVRLSRPYNALLYTLAVLGIVPEHAYGEGYGENPVGSGRYVLERWDKGEQAIFAANPDYYGEPPLMQRVVVVFMAEDAALAAVRAGQVDIAYTYATFADQKVDGYELACYESVDSRGISLPVSPAGGTREHDGATYAAGNDVTCDVALRRAVSLGIDREAVVEAVLAGYGHPAYSVCDGMPWASDDMRVDFDPDRAAALLDEAGWAAAADGVRERDGVRAAFDLWYSSDDSTRQAIANEFANQMARLGIEVSPRGGSWDEVYLHQFESPVLWGWGSNSPVELYELNCSTGWGNYAGYASDATDRHLDLALAQTDVEASYAHWRDAQWDGEEGFAPKGAATWAWIASVDHLYFKRRGLDVARQKPHPHGHGWSLANNVDRWTWE